MIRMMLPKVDDAADRHLEDVVTDIVALLGPGIELDQLAIVADDSCPVTLRATYRMADAGCESLGRGESVIEAHARLREAIIEDRIGLGLRVLVR